MLIAPTRSACCIRPARGHELDELGDLRGGTDVMATALKISAAQFLPERKTLATLREAAAHCKGCPLYQRARTVFGEGLKRARLMLVGEQPGNEEDRRREVRWFIADLERVAEGLKKEAA